MRLPRRLNGPVIGRAPGVRPVLARTRARVDSGGITYGMGSPDVHGEKRRLALVTGASGGIGRAIAIALARETATIVLAYGSDSAAAEQAARDVGDAGAQPVLVAADLATDLGIAAVADCVREKGEPLDTLVNNAGIGLRETLTGTDGEAFDRVIAVNLRAPFLLARALEPQLRSGGRVINISSLAATRGYPDHLAYAVTKGGLEAMTLSLAAHLGGRGITVNAVAPGAVRGGMMAERFDEEATVAAVRAATALGRIGEPDDIAEIVAFLASPAARWITGQVVVASGGLKL